MIDIDRPNWMDRGLCSTGDAALLEMFFPVRGGDSKRAKQICTQCPVREECLEYALDNCVRFGIWGGMSERERRQMRATRATDGQPVRHLNGVPS